MDRFESAQQGHDDVGAPAPSAIELQQLLELGRTTNNDALSRLVTAYQALRRFGAEAITDIENEYGPDAIERSVPLQLVKQFTTYADK